MKKMSLNPLVKMSKILRKKVPMMFNLKKLKRQPQKKNPYKKKKYRSLLRKHIKDISNFLEDSTLITR